MKNRFFTSVLLASLVALSLFATSVIAAEKVFVFARPLIGGMDPATSGDSEGSQNLSLVYDTLIMIDKNGDIAPGLAKSWKVSSDYKTFTFDLRKGIKFHDGTPFNAHAVKFAYDRMLRVNRTSYGYYLKYGTPDGITVIDDHTVQIKLKKAFPIFLVDMAATAYGIVSPAFVKKNSSSDDPDALKVMTDHANGTGPFKMVEYTLGQRIVYEKYNGYWGSANSIKSSAKIDKLIIKVIKDPSTARLMVEKGDVDLAEKLTVEQFEKMRSNNKVQVLDFTLPKVVYITMDVSKPPFDDVNVRKAIAYAIKTDEIIKYIEKGNAARMHGLIPAGIMGHNPDLPAYMHDLKKAKQLLKDSKYPNGFTTNLIFAESRRPEFEQVGEYVQAYLKKIGIKVNVQKLAFDTQLAKMDKGNYGMSMMTWTTTLPDPEDIAGWLYDSNRSSGGWNGSFWFDKDVLRMISEAREIADMGKRKKLYQTIDRKAVEGAVYTNLYQLSQQYAAGENVNSVYYHPLTKIHFWEIDK